MVVMITDGKDIWAVNKRGKTRKRLKFYTPATTSSSMSLTELHEGPGQPGGGTVLTVIAQTLPTSLVFDTFAQDSSLGSLAPSSTITFLTTFTSDSATVSTSPTAVPIIASTPPSKSSVLY